VNLAILDVRAASDFEAFFIIFFLGDLSPAAAFTLGRTTLPAVALLAGATPFSNLYIYSIVITEVTASLMLVTLKFSPEANLTTP
jgi:hypothetical protein